MDFYNEWILKKKRDLKDWLKISLSVIGALVLIYIAMCLVLLLRNMFVLVIAGIIYLAYKIIKSTSVEYEYTVTNTDLDIDKIVARSKRTKVVSLNVRKIEYFAPYTEKYAQQYKNESITKRLDCSSGRADAKRFFAIYYNNGEKLCIIFEPTDKMIAHFETYVPRYSYYTE